uniref:Uncharacterized protein n=1 Tax=Rhizophora mucronata TaxID=61149 RepID=A0A2P2NSU9_RHIMU
MKRIEIYSHQFTNKHKNIAACSQTLQSYI